MENNNYKQLINESYEKFTDDVDIMWQKSGVGDLDDFIYDGLIISGYDDNNKWFGRLPTEEEFINKVKSDEGFSKRWGIKIEERELDNDEIINYYYTNIKPKSKWKKDEDNRYFYFTESDDECYWTEHSTSDIIFGMKPLCPSKLITITYNEKTEIGYE